MNDGINITDGIKDFGNAGGGVAVYNGGNFIMNGGIISGNLCYPGPEMIKNAQLRVATQATTSAVITSKTTTANYIEPVTYGGGVYISSNGTFTKTGGTITGYASDKENGNVVRDASGNIAKSNGHAVYVDSEPAKRKETTAGPETNLYYGNGEFSGDWDE
jgi:hypothetical protein